jgi:hypothetical protein
MSDIYLSTAPLFIYCRRELAIMTDNATLAYRLTAQPNDRMNVVIGAIHIIWFVLAATTTVMWFNQIRLRMRIFGFWGISRGMLLVFLLHLLCTLCEIAYMGFLPAGFKRSGGVVGDPAYEIDQVGYLNSASTAWCDFTSCLLYFSLNSMLLTLALLIYDTYTLAVKPMKSSGAGRRSSLMMVSGNGCTHLTALLKRNPYTALVSLIPFVSLTIQMVFADQGPMGAYCGIRCREKGMDAIFTSEGACWVRLPAFFANCIVIGPFTIFNAIRLLLHIRRVTKNSLQKTIRKNSTSSNGGSGGDAGAPGKKKKTATQKMRSRMIWFSLALAFMTIGAGILRIRSSLAPDPLVEGTTGLTDYISLVVLPAAIYTFSLELWLGVFGCSSHVKDQVRTSIGGFVSDYWETSSVSLFLLFIVC